MNNIVKLMLKRYTDIHDVDSAKNVIKQCLQEVALSGLGRSDFFKSITDNLQSRQ